ncbi:DNA-binding helix-turn-helix protein [Lentilactobacillus parafarraginis F0439]|uniref:DNA-binding helix-turn-helix protein n=1 Tax=Lentilactobacillus parafarraginis F0439 TaxID=797515 RepID=G9ZNP2_9LACO|nr:helix-turn-helix domain-containing protein [Lentilactobacillus parafarraginis]EHL98790.1 DNA-binding helix-turn-helix protein [Lentilactobacillus parafarraginis F0439]
MSNKTSIGESIKTKGIQTGIIQETLAERGGISVNYLSKLETGKRTSLRATTPFKLSQVLGAHDYFRANLRKGSESTLDVQK